VKNCIKLVSALETARLRPFIPLQSILTELLPRFTA
jgi:hypothetical protein